MTLLLALANEKHAILVADRRVTSGGKLIDDEHNKVCILFCQDAKLAAAFTGLANLRGFDTATWIATTLSDIGETQGDIATILAEFARRAEDTFSGFSSPPPMVTILFCGYVYWGAEPEQRVYILSNAGNGGSQSVFQQFSFAGSEPIVEVAGMSSALSESIRTGLLSLLQQDVPPQSLLRFAIKHMRNAARDGRSGGLIGEQFNAAVLKAVVDTVVTSTYHSATGSRAAYGANVVVTSGMIALGSELFSTTLLSGPEIRKKDPCWCGSGELFKHCHLRKFGAVYMRLPEFKRPLAMFTRLEFETPRRSGKVCCVASSFA